MPPRRIAAFSHFTLRVTVRPTGKIDALRDVVHPRSVSTLAEIEQAVETLPRPEQEVLLRHLTERLRAAPAGQWPVPPPNVPRDEIRRIQAEIDATFSRVEAEG